MRIHCVMSQMATPRQVGGRHDGTFNNTQRRCVQLLLPSYKYVLDNLKEQASVWDEVTTTAHDGDENGKKTVNPYNTLEKQLQAWLHQLPVLGFNSGYYDLNTIKLFFVPLLIRNSDTEHASCFVIKRQNSSMCLSTDKMKFIAMVKYLAPGYSYDKYLKAYGCELEIGHFPYEYMDAEVRRSRSTSTRSVLQSTQ